MIDHGASSVAFIVLDGRASGPGPNVLWMFCITSFGRAASGLAHRQPVAEGRSALPGQGGSSHAQLMDDHQDSARPVLVWLDDAQARCPTSVGSKAALLAVVRSHGFVVPDGFVVTGAAYRAAVDAAGIDAALSYPVGLCSNACAESRFRAELLAQAEVPAHVADAIGHAYYELGRRTGRADPVVAVRTSVVGEEATFGPTAPALTGIVGRDGVTEAVTACWRALFNERAMITRAALRPQFEPEMAVLVQQMVPTLRSGTAYSTDPVRRRPDLVRITATSEEQSSGPWLRSRTSTWWHADPTRLLNSRSERSRRGGRRSGTP
jgi:Pyruvate phosphate dikinase, AMP/ATP-binding domain